MNPQYKKLVDSIDKTYQWCDHFTTWKREQNKVDKAIGIAQSLKTEKARQKYLDYYYNHMRSSAK